MDYNSAEHLAKAKIDLALLTRLNHLNDTYKLGLAIKSGPTTLKRPAYADAKLWRGIEKCTSKLHKTEPARLICILDAYEKWAQEQSAGVEWIQKDRADPRLLGEPKSHILQLEKLFGISQYSSRPLNTDSAPTSAAKVAYPAFSEEDKYLLATSKLDTTPEQLNRKSFERPSSTSLSHTSHSELPLIKPLSRSLTLRDLNTSKKRLRKELVVDDRPTKSARASPGTSFSSNKSSFDGNLFQSRHQSFNDTPATSFGQTQPDQPPYREVSQGQPRLVNQASFLRNELRQPESTALDRHEEGPKCLIHQDGDIKQISSAPSVRVGQNSQSGSRSGFSQMSSSLEAALIQTDEKMRGQKRRSTISSIARSSQLRDETSPSTFMGTPEEVAEDLSIFSDNCSPFQVANLQLENIDLRHLPALYETTRFFLHSRKRISINYAKRAVNNSDNYDKLWSFLLSHVKPSVAPLKGAQDAWVALAEGCESVTLSGKLVLRDASRKNLGFDFQLSPLKKTLTSHRFGRRFGSHRFFDLEIPQLSNEVTIDMRERLINWLASSRHCFLGRHWKAIYVKEVKTKAKATKERSIKVYMFAEKGPGMEELARDTMVDWLLHVRKNRGQSALKLFSRISLGLTDTRPGCTFEEDQIVYTHDACSCCPGLRRLDTDALDRPRSHKHVESAPVMNDGAARMSLAAARKIARRLNLSYVPSAFQGRICGAKGMWIVDYSQEKNRQKENHPGTSEDIWIEITNSQKKFKMSKRKVQNEQAHRTFDVKSYSRPLSKHHLNDMLIPILEDRGVPRSSFFQLLEDDLELQVEELKLAMREGDVVLRKWIQDNFLVASERSTAGEVKMSGGFPLALSEKLIMLCEAGFNPKSDHVFWSYCKDSLGLLRYLETRDAIPVARSTYAFMIPDPLGVLEEGEIQINFSTPFETLQADNLRRRFFDEDVLIARFPAYLPSDIQKVKAVFNPLLSQYEDVVIFSVRSKDNRASLAHLLSGGDFDGDTAFVCWEPLLVNHFENSSPPPDPSPEVFGMEQDKTKASAIFSSGGMDAFLQKGFQFNMQQSMLGICAKWYMSRNYRQMDIHGCLDVGALLGMLVDAPKQGWIFDKTRWEAYLESKNLPKWYGEPFYKADRLEQERLKPTDHTLDQLCLQKTIGCKRKIRDAFEGAFEETPGPYDKTFVMIYESEVEFAKRFSKQSYKEIFHKLHNDIQELYDLHNTEMAKLERARRSLAKTKSGTSSTSQQQDCSGVLRQLRQRFLDIQPAESDYHMRERWLGDWQETSKQELVAGTEVCFKQLATKGSWTYLKASALYARTHHKTYWNKFPWLIAGVELCRMKAESLGGYNRVIRPSVHAALKPDSKYTRKLKESISIPGLLENAMDLEEEGENATIDDWLSTAGATDYMRDD